MTVDEDRSQARSGAITQVMDALRNTAIGLLRCIGTHNITAACRYCAVQPGAALALLGLAPENDMTLIFLLAG